MPIEYDQGAPVEHKKVVESGMYDLIVQPAPYAVGDFVISRFSDAIYFVTEDNGDTIVAGYGTGNEKVQREFARNDVRPVHGYAKAIYRIVFPYSSVEIDNHGHALSRYDVRDLPRMTRGKAKE